MSSFCIKTVVSFELQFLHKFDMNFFISFLSPMMPFYLVMLLLVFPFGGLKLKIIKIALVIAP